MKVNKNKLQSMTIYLLIFFIGATLTTGWFYIRFKNINLAKLESKRIEISPDELINNDFNKESVNKIDSSKYEDISLVINKDEELIDGYIPRDLRVVNIEFCFKGQDEQKNMRSEAATNLEQLVKDAKGKGIKLVGVSGYRSYETQATFYNNSVEKQGIAHAEKFSAKAGTSEHQTGLAIDLTCKSVDNKLIQSFDTTKEGIWLKNNAYKYGFILRYPKGKEEITGYSYEPWHIRYVGKDLAKYIKEHNITLEEAKISTKLYKFKGRQD